MKKFLLSFILVLVSASSVIASLPVVNLPSVTMLSTTTCPACKQMERVFHQAKLQYPDKFVTAHIYLEDNPAIARKYNVRYVPTLIFRDASGKEIAQKIGFMPLTEVVKVFESANAFESPKSPESPDVAELVSPDVKPVSADVKI